MPPPWYVYLLVSTVTGRTYVGATTDPARRLRQHNGEIAGGARSTIPGRPWKHVDVVGPFTHGEALRKERWVKKARGVEGRGKRLGSLKGQMSRR